MNTTAPSIRILYAFPESLPLPHARGIQIAHTLASLLDEDCSVSLAYVSEDPEQDPLSFYGLHPKRSLDLIPLSRHGTGLFHFLPIQSNRFFNKQLTALINTNNEQFETPDVIMTRHFKTAYALLKLHPEIPLVYEAHEVFAQSTRPENRSKHTQMERYVLQHATRVIAISEALANALSNYHGVYRQYDILRSGTKLPDSIPIKTWGNCAKEIIYSGSLHEWKGVEDLISAVQWLPGHRVTIVGGSEDQIAYLRKLVPKEGGEVVFMPYKTHLEIQALLMRACIAVLPNRSNSISAWTSPLKLFEYMGAGCAIVATDLPSIQEILSPEDTLLVPSNDPQALAKAIQTFTAKPQFADSTGQHLRKIAKGFSWEMHGQRLSNILREASLR